MYSPTNQVMENVEQAKAKVLDSLVDPLVCGDSGVIRWEEIERVEGSSRSVNNMGLLILLFLS